ncbi:MAG: glycosyltransferase [Desulfobacterales bacterium]
MDCTNNPSGIQNLIICIPVYNDWESLMVLVENLDLEIGTLDGSVSILIVDDGSTENPPDNRSIVPSHIEKIEIIQLRRNLGHQRAIAMGLSYIYANYECQAVLIMDGDGEDDPKDVHTLVDRCCRRKLRKIIFAKRSKRSDGLIFKLGYISYKIVHYLLTGIKVEVGNFSIIPYQMLTRLMGVSEIWNHYAASVFHARLPLEMVPIPRGERIAGKSRMNYTSLIVHGMSAISVFGETVAVRLLCVVSLLMLFTIGGLFTSVLIRFCTDLAIPGWATNLTGILGIVMLNLLLLAIFSVLMMLNSRDRLSFLPIRDWQYFIEKTITIYD